MISSNVQECKSKNTFDLNKTFIQDLGGNGLQKLLALSYK